MTTEDALLRAILDNPDDDTPRLAYADHLDETPTPKRVARAAFIRDQIEIARAVHTSEPVSREEATLRKYGSGWLPAAARVEASNGVWVVSGNVVRVDWHFQGTFEFERGFISKVAVAVRFAAPEVVPNNFSDHAEKFVRQCFASDPIESLTLTAEGHQPRISLVFKRVKKKLVATIDDGEGSKWINEGRQSRAAVVNRLADRWRWTVHTTEWQVSEIPF